MIDVSQWRASIGLCSFAPPETMDCGTTVKLFYIVVGK